MPLANFPATAGAKRDAAIMDAIRKGAFEVQWGTVRSHTADGHTAEFRIFADALKIDGVRVNVSAQLAQQIADLLGCALPSAKISDLRWLQRTVTLAPITQPPVNMDTTALMIKESAAIDAALAVQGVTDGMICTVGKEWVLDNGMVDANGQGKLLAGVPMACNYGWHMAQSGFQGATWDPCAGGQANCFVIQGRGFRHDFKHTDYSQNLILVSRRCFVDGAERDLADIYKDPTLSVLATYGGPLKITRQPGVPEEPMIVAATPGIGPGTPQFVSWTSDAVSSDGTSLTWVGATLLAIGTGIGFFLWKST